MSVNLRRAAVVLVGLAVIAGVWAIAGRGSSLESGPATTSAATATTQQNQTANPPAVTTTTVLSITTTSEVDSAGVEQQVAATIPETTTTTVPLEPIDERLPRTGAAATETDPVPVGEVVEATPGLWDIALTGIDLDAAETVRGFADINPEPAPGYQYVLVTIEGTYLGGQVAQPVFEWAVLAGGQEYLPSIPGCGVIPESIYDVVEVVPGESFVAHMCMPVAGEDLEGGAELYLNAPGDDPRYFSLG
jgi:hypothetical protein